VSNPDVNILPRRELPPAALKTPNEIAGYQILTREQISLRTMVEIINPLISASPITHVSLPMLQWHIHTCNM
jgi:hypothetical protein